MSKDVKRELIKEFCFNLILICKYTKFVSLAAIGLINCMFMHISWKKSFQMFKNWFFILLVGSASEWDNYSVERDAGAQFHDRLWNKYFEYPPTPPVIILWITVLQLLLKASTTHFYIRAIALSLRAAFSEIRFLKYYLQLSVKSWKLMWGERSIFEIIKSNDIYKKNAF